MVDMINFATLPARTAVKSSSLGRVRETVKPTADGALEGLPR